MNPFSLTSQLSWAFAKRGRSRDYGSPRHLTDYMLKDIGITPEDLGLMRRR